MKGSKQLFSSAKSGGTDSWATPQPFYDLLDHEFGGFNLDPCASADNAKAPYFSIDEGNDGLALDWGGKGTKAFVNFPYSQANAWANKCVEEQKKGALVVVLCAARTDTGWWHHLVTHAESVRFVRGRLAFDNGKPNSATSATFPSCVIVLKPGFNVNPGNCAQPDEFYNLFQGVTWTVPSHIRRGQPAPEAA